MLPRIQFKKSIYHDGDIYHGKFVYIIRPIGWIDFSNENIVFINLFFMSANLYHKYLKNNVRTEMITVVL